MPKARSTRWDDAFDPGNFSVRFSSLMETDFKLDPSIRFLPRKGTKGRQLRRDLHCAYRRERDSFGASIALCLFVAKKCRKPNQCVGDHAFHLPIVPFVFSALPTRS